MNRVAPGALAVVAALAGWATATGPDPVVTKLVELGTRDRSARHPALLIHRGRVYLDTVEADQHVVRMFTGEGLSGPVDPPVSPAEVRAAYPDLDRTEAVELHLSDPVWSRGLLVSGGRRLGWSPARCADAEGRMYLAFDAASSGDYDVLFQPPGAEPQIVAGTARAECKPALAVDGAGRVWLAWQEGPERWGHTDTLHADFRIRIACREDGSWHEVPPPAELAGPSPEPAELPRLAADETGALWLFWRSMDTWENQTGSGPPLHAGWKIRAAALTASGWSRAVELPDSGGPGYDTLAVAALPGGGILAAYESDARYGISPIRQFGPACFAAPSAVQVALLRIEGKAPGPTTAGQVLPGGRRSPPSAPAPGDPDPSLVPAGYLRLWGDLHRHSSISRCAASKDGTLIDQYRYAMDVAGLDFLAVTDHHNHMTPDAWAMSRELVAAFHRPAELVTLYGFERLLPSGHRNFFCADPEQAVDAPFRGSPKRIWDGYPAGKWLAVPHMLTATRHVFIWSAANLRIERDVEIYQGRRGAYESVRGPLRDLRALDQYPHAITYLRDGKRFGFVAASDHTANLRGFTAVLVPARTRAAVYAALLARRCYAATARIALDVQLDDLLMGEAGPVTPDASLHIRADAGSDIARVQVIRRGKVAHQWTGTDPERVLLTVRWGRQEMRRRLRVVVEDGLVEKALPLFLESEDRLALSPEGVLSVQTRTYGNDEDGAVATVRRTADSVVHVQLGRKQQQFALADLAAGPVRFHLGGVPMEISLDPAPLGGRRFDASWAPGDWAPGDWVYVRLVRADGQVAWSSPIWIDTEEAPATPADRLGWFREARFGIFVHWGPVALTGREIGWSRGRQTPREEYDALYRRFDPVRFDANAWAELAADAGARYLVLTTKHHDGFCLWPSAQTDHDIAATPFRRDVVGELAAACRRHGLRFGAYYSIADWHHPDYSPQNEAQGGAGEALPPDVAPDMDRYQDYLEAQLRELVTRYHPALLWFDGEWEEPWTAARGERLAAFLRDLDPALIWNNRIGKGRTARRAASNPGHWDTPEQVIGAFQVERPWETCLTLATQWAWKPDDPVKSLETCIAALVRCAAGDGNLLLNVGPRADGSIEPEQARRLREIGAWLRSHGESIYGTRGGPWRPGSWGGSTRRGRRIYLHVLDWPGPDLWLPAFPGRITGARLLAGGGTVDWSQDRAGRVRVSVPAVDREAIDTVVVLETAAPVTALAAAGDCLSRFAVEPGWGRLLSRDATFTASSTSRWDDPALHPRLLDPRADNPPFVFHTAIDEHPWIRVDLGGVHRLTAVEIGNRPGYEDRAAGLALSVSEDGRTWRRLWTAPRAARRWEVPLRDLAGAPVPARYLKLEIRPDPPAPLHLRSLRIWGDP